MPVPQTGALSDKSQLVAPGAHLLTAERHRPLCQRWQGSWQMKSPCSTLVQFRPIADCASSILCFIRKWWLSFFSNTFLDFSFPLLFLMSSNAYLTISCSDPGVPHSPTSVMLKDKAHLLTSLIWWVLIKEIHWYDCVLKSLVQVSNFSWTLTISISAIFWTLRLSHNII